MLNFILVHVHVCLARTFDFLSSSAPGPVVKEFGRGSKELGIPTGECDHSERAADGCTRHHTLTSISLVVS